MKKKKQSKKKNFSSNERIYSMGDKIRYIRCMREINRENLSQLSSIKLHEIRCCEENKKSLDDEVVQSIASVLRMHYEDFFSWKSIILKTGLCVKSQVNKVSFVHFRPFFPVYRKF